MAVMCLPPNSASRAKYPNIFEIDGHKTDPSGEKKETKFKDLVIPTQMRRWSASFSGIDAFLKPDQSMAGLHTNEYES